MHAEGTAGPRTQAGSAEHVKGASLRLQVQHLGTNKACVQMNGGANRQDSIWRQRCQQHGRTPASGQGTGGAAQASAGPAHLDGLLDDAAAVHLRGQGLDRAAHGARQARALRRRAVLQELLDDVVAKHVAHEPERHVGAGADLVKDGLHLAGGTSKAGDSQGAVGARTMPSHCTNIVPGSGGSTGPAAHYLYKASHDLPPDTLRLLQESPCSWTNPDLPGRQGMCPWHMRNPHLLLRSTLPGSAPLRAWRSRASAG